MLDDILAAIRTYGAVPFGPISAVAADPGAGIQQNPAIPQSGLTGNAAMPSPAIPQSGLPAPPTAGATPTLLDPGSAPLGMLNQGGAPMSFGGITPTPPPPSSSGAGTGEPISTPMSIAPPAAASAPSAPPAAVPDSSLMGRLGNVFGRIGDAINAHPQMLMAMGAGLAGAPTLGMGLSRAFAGAGPASQLDIRQGQQNATIQALKARGIPDDIAIAASTNPLIMSQMLPQLFGAKQRQFTQIGEDALGNKKFGFVDPVTNKVFDLSGQEVTNAAGAASNIPNSPTTGQPMQGQELLAHLEKTDPVAAAGVKSIIAGNENASGRNLQKLLPLAALVEPGFTQQSYQTRLALAKSYTSGKQFNEMQAINTVAGHLTDLAGTASKLDNFENLGVLNAPVNALVGKTRELSQDPRVTDFNTVKQAVSNELSKAYRGGHVTEGDVREWQSNISAVQTPTQLRTVIGRLNELLASKRQALEDGWAQGMGANPLPVEFRAESERARNRFNSVANWSLGTGPVPEPALGARQTQQQNATKPTPDDARAQARDAIARGADRNAIVARLKSMGIDPSGL